MVTKELTAFRMDLGLMRALRALREKEGIPMAVAVDFALREWLQRRGVQVKKADRKRASITRKRS